jgi:hypothetical protein
MPPNKSLQGPVIDKVPGCGRSGVLLEQVVRARVLKGRRLALNSAVRRHDIGCAIGSDDRIRGWCVV